jgi:hypothetical protein
MPKCPKCGHTIFWLANYNFGDHQLKLLTCSDCQSVIGVVNDNSFIRATVERIAKFLKVSQ